MRVLVTRPLPAAESTARRLEAVGHQPVLLPLMQATHLPAAANAALKMPYAATILTSAETVRVLASLNGSPTDHLAIPCFCVGEATARAAEDLGFADIRVGNGTGEALAALIAATIGTRAKRPLLYLTGTPRSEGLESALRQSGIDHEAVECYRMEPIAHSAGALQDATRTGPFGAVLLYSRETASRLAILLSESGISAPSFASRYLCLSAAIADALPHDAMREVAARPDEESLFSIL
ncbi:uroporphyrinogen-III synthase [Ensifer adhaerens]|uniref:uroporphyrinogen-III synthase n=1 Tax=Ensifer adhaerens TaxID=106592 RepID=UPI0023A93DFB|nr:uroporphyrinogen-III synthase [Ensifer adhaerens]WDZ76344.1 uroporphyrinogen-III synthase [Ensifer adhaerens]